MKNSINILLACSSLCLLMLFSCGKNSIFSNGETVERTLDYSEHAFSVLELCDDVDVELLHSDPDHPSGTIFIRAGENLIDHIIADTSKSDTVTINNLNKMNWLRPFEAVREMTIYYDTLSTILFNSNGKLNSDIIAGFDIPMTVDSIIIINSDTITLVDTIPIPDTISSTSEIVRSALMVQILGGSGILNLKVNCYKLDILYQAGTADVNVSGNAPISYVYTDENAHGPVRCNKLTSNIFYITAYGTNIVAAKAFHAIDAYNYNNGIVCYVGYQGLRKIFVNNNLTYDTVSCPEILQYNGNSISSQSYTDSIPGLRKVTE